MLVISKAFDFFGKDAAVCVSGGKDANVVLDLVMRVHAMQRRRFDLSFFYFQLPNQFPELLHYLPLAERHWHMRLTRIVADSLKAGLAEAIGRYGVHAVFLGERQSDAHGVRHRNVEPTSAGWPPAARVFPVLNWSFADIWEYIDALDLPVCELYRRGFASIGEITNTQPNPLLWDEDANQYRHARELAHDVAERLGRSARERNNATRAPGSTIAGLGTKHVRSAP
jgi:FAD synthetase